MSGSHFLNGKGHPTLTRCQGSIPVGQSWTLCGGGALKKEHLGRAGTRSIYAEPL